MDIESHNASKLADYDEDDRTDSHSGNEEQEKNERSPQQLTDNSSNEEPDTESRQNEDARAYVQLSNGPSTQTMQLLQEIGGGVAIKRLTEEFYSRFFQDAYLHVFVNNQSHPHSERLANWIIEKMGGEGDVWTEELAVRNSNPVPVILAGGRSHIVSDRTSAHHASWYSPHRPPNKVGQRFKLHDSRIWMRLIFWSARATSLLTFPKFANWFTRFIGHFIRVYESTAPMFARESVRWSANQDNILKYREDGNRMTDIVDVNGDPATDFYSAKRGLPMSESSDWGWPYK